MTVLVTGAAGFIGFHLSSRLLERGSPVLGFDNVNPYYDPSLKRARIAQLQAIAARTGTSFQLIEADLEDRAAVEAAFAQHKPNGGEPGGPGGGALLDRKSGGLHPEQPGGLWPHSRGLPAPRH